MKSGKTIAVTAAICFLLFLAALIAGSLPFYVFDGAEYGEAPAALLSADYWLRLVPLAIILTAAALGILLTARLRWKGKDRSFGKLFRSRAGERRTAVQAQKPSGFMAARWAILIASSILMIFGGTVFGLRFAGVSLPVLSCDFNTTQLTETSCYYLSHLTDLFQMPLSTILMFLVSTVGAALLLGRVICGFLCPMGLVQDLMHVLRQRVRGEGVRWNERQYDMVKPVKWVMVLLMLGLCFVGADFCAFCPAASLSPALAGIRVSLYFSGYLMILLLAGGFFKRRLFCNICPLGTLLGLANRVSPFRIKKDCQSCTECGVCYDACPMGIKAIYTEREKADVTDSRCIFCGECIRRCPENNALSMTFCGQKIYTASRSQAVSGYDYRKED